MATRKSVPPSAPAEGTTTARMFKSDHHWVKVHAAVHGKDMQQVLAEAIAEYKKKRGA